MILNTDKPKHASDSFADTSSDSILYSSNRGSLLTMSKANATIDIDNSQIDIPQIDI